MPTNPAQKSPWFEKHSGLPRRICVSQRMAGRAEFVVVNLFRLARCCPVFARPPTYVAVFEQKQAIAEQGWPIAMHMRCVSTRLRPKLAGPRKIVAIVTVPRYSERLWPRRWHTGATGMVGQDSFITEIIIRGLRLLAGLRAIAARGKT